jgi:hypothetical protein
VIPQRRVTRVRSQILRPDGKPSIGRLVAVQILAAPPWMQDRAAQILGTSTTWTGPDGRWEMDIVPADDFKSPGMVVAEVSEFTADRRHPLVQYARVPVSDEAVQLGDILVPDPRIPPEKWCVIDTIGSLNNVDPRSDRPEDGSTLVAYDGMWTTSPNSLAALIDVDVDSVADAQPGDVLTMQDSGLWGAAARQPPDNPELTGSYGNVPGDPPYGPSVRLTILTRNTEKTVHIDWGDGSGNDVPGDYIDHVYPECDSYYTELSYTDGSYSKPDFINPCDT